MQKHDDGQHDMAVLGSADILLAHRVMVLEKAESAVSEIFITDQIEQTSLV